MLEVAAAPLPATTSDVGIDLGRTSMAVLSNGEVIENPRHVRRRALARAQQALAAKTKGSKRRAEAARLLLASIARSPRLTWTHHHKLA